MDRKIELNFRSLRFVLMIAGAALLCALLWQQVLLALRLLAGGMLIAFLLEPLCTRLERKLKRPLAVLASYALAALALAGVLLLLAPTLVNQLSDLIDIAPRAFEKAKLLLERMNVWLEQHAFPPLELQMVDWQAVASSVTSAMGGTIVVAVGVAGGTARLSMMLVLSVYFLIDWGRILLLLELLIPSQARTLVLRMAASIKRELWLYLRGQVFISGIVGLLAGVGLALLDVPYFALLAVLVALFNLIPYFGPLLGAIPAVLMALTRGLDVALLTVLIMFVIQQADSLVISPRIMSGLTGISPPAVLVAITVGSSLWGVVGMLLALPILLVMKICFRVWAGRNEKLPANNTANKD